jgi:hypothetical protein
MKLEFSRQFFEKSSDIKFNENPSTGSQVVPCRRTDGQMDLKLIVAFLNFAKAPKNCIKGNLKQTVRTVQVWNGFIWLSVRFVGCLFQHGNKAVGSIKEITFLDQLSNS